MTHAIQPKYQPGRGDVRTIQMLQNGKVGDEANRLANESKGQNGGYAGSLLLDFRHVDYVISEDLGALIGLHKRVKSEGGRLTLVNVHPMVFDVLSITKLDTLFDVHRATDGPAVNKSSQ